MTVSQGIMLGRTFGSVWNERTNSGFFANPCPAQRLPEIRAALA
ncbi:hypothetical protein [Thioflavicoccus mobilis]|nr:hypothetical protein [Thioflavicoccus mobilis]